MLPTKVLPPNRRKKNKAKAVEAQSVKTTKPDDGGPSVLYTGNEEETISQNEDSM